VIISIPSFDPEEIVEIEPKSISQMNLAALRRYEDCVNWKCSECRSINFGRNKSCAYCRGRLKKQTLRPASYSQS